MCYITLIVFITKILLSITFTFLFMFIDNRRKIRGKVKGWVHFCTCLMGNTLLISCRSFAYGILHGVRLR